MKIVSLLLVIALVLVFAVGSVTAVTNTITNATTKSYVPTLQDEKFINWMEETDELLYPCLKSINDAVANDEFHKVDRLWREALGICRQAQGERYNHLVSSEMQHVKVEYGNYLNCVESALEYLGKYKSDIVLYRVSSYSYGDYRSKVDGECGVYKKSSADMLEEFLAEVPEPTPTPTPTPKPTPVATQKPTPVATPSPTPEPTPEPSHTPEVELDSDSDGVPDKYDYAPTDPTVQTKEDTKTPGFGVIFAICSLIAVAYLVRRRSR
jgi:PGF-CTERM protein